MSSVRESEYGPRSPGSSNRQVVLRALNDRVADAGRRHHFETARIPFQCECGRLGCEEFALHTLAEYEELRQSQLALLAPGHAS